MARLFIVAAVVLMASMQCEATKFNKCSLVHELRKQGFVESDLRNWVCLVQNESNYDPLKVSRPNKNGSIDYGLFQINDKYWCTRSGPAGKDCHVTCADVHTQDITKAATCAKKVFKRHGFRAWYGWRNHCQGALPDISSC